MLILFYLVMFQDAAGYTFTPRQALDEFGSASRAPIYACYDTYLGHGIFGGTMVTFEEIGRKAAQLGMRILAGEDPQSAANSESALAGPNVLIGANSGDGRSAKNRCHPAASSAIGN